MINIDDLAKKIEVPKRTLTYFAYGLDDSKKYVKFHIAKRSGGSREILAPIPRLKIIQRKMAALIKEIYLPAQPIAVHGYGNKRSIVTNAAVHSRRRYIFKCDIENFYPSIRGARVFGILKRPPFNFTDDAAHLVAKLCTYNGYLPQGAPSSPVFSNIICRRLDGKLMKFARSNGGLYTRYADDITISFMSRRMASKCLYSSEGVNKDFEHLIISEDFSLNLTKTRLLEYHNRQIVTGVIVNDRLNVRKEYISDLRNLIYILGKYGDRAALNSYKRKKKIFRPSMDILRIIEGKLHYLAAVRGYEDLLFLKLLKGYQRYKPDFLASPTGSPTVTTSQIGARILAEGKTDYIHIEVALSHFKSRSCQEQV